MGIREGSITAVDNPKPVLVGQPEDEGRLVVPGLEYQLILQRLGQDINSTTGILMTAVNIGEFARGEALCFILEDIFREVKVKGKTRFPAGLVRLTKVKASNILNKMRRWYPELPWIVGIEGVANYSLLRIHTGVEEDHTEGCPLTAHGAHASFKLSAEDGILVDSRDCYRQLHDRVFVPMFDDWPEPRMLVRDESFLLG